MTLSQRIKKLRQEKNLSQLELAKKIGMSQQTIANYEQSVAIPRMNTVKKLANALGVSEQYLLFGKDDNAYEESSILEQMKPASYQPRFIFDDDSAVQNPSIDQKVQPKVESPELMKKTIQFEYKDEVLPEEYSDFILMIKQFKSLNGKGRRRVLDYLHDISQLYGKKDV